MVTRKKKIINLVLAKKAEIADPEKARANQRLAIPAVTGGLGSTAWETYMRQFVSDSDPEQLGRLLATDGTAGDQDMIDARAYLVSNGVCGEGTRERFEENVRTIDRDLPIPGDTGDICDPFPPV
jgi:hypothetical protein